MYLKRYQLKGICVCRILLERSLIHESVCQWVKFSNFKIYSARMIGGEQRDIHFLKPMKMEIIPMFNQPKSLNYH